VYRERSDLTLRIGFALDIGMIVLGFLLAYYIKTNWLPSEYQGLAQIQEYGWIVLIYMFLLVGMMYLTGLYTFGRTMGYTDIAVNVFLSVAVTITVLTLLLFVLKVQTISRFLVFIYGIVSWALLVAEKSALKSFINTMARRGVTIRNILVCGSGSIAEHLIESVKRRPELGYRVLGCVDVDPGRIGSEVMGVPVVGIVDRLDDLLNDFSVDEVFFAIPSHLVQNMDKLVYLCEEVGVRANIVWDIYKPSIAKTSVRNFLDMPVLTFTATPLQVGQLMVKQLMDYVLSVAGLIVLAPLLAAVALAVKLTSPGPVFFSQVRSGLNGRTFKMIKFRTMVADAEQRKEELLDQNEMSGPVFKMKKDPRITRLGAFLRNSSIDELPQLFNVLKGEMSLVGPRPPIPEEVANYERWQRRRLSMKPGITCFWQISGRNQIDFEEWMRLDLKYIDNWSLRLDLVILLKTVPVVILRRGAA